jgi:anthranilate/para-aminobenzoate synthase component I
VEGQLRPPATLADILRATFPGGSITGAPKIRAMQIIAEVEQEARGIYTGAIGSFNGSREILLNVAIRTAVASAGLVHYRSGGGVVADSMVETEFEETVTKARAYLESVLSPDAEAKAAAP